MKHLIIYYFIALAIGIAPVTGKAEDIIPSKVLSIFHESFPEIKSPHWTKYKDFIEVYYTLENSSVRIDYSLEGDVLASIRYMTAELLCPNIRSKIVKAYPGKQIYAITEFSKDDATEYYIVLQDDAQIYNIKCTKRGNVKLLSSYLKSR